MSKTIIEIKNVSREINAANDKTKVLLSDISWTCHTGSRVAVLSRSHLSAQAFLECASGVTAAQKGSVTINGHISWPIGMRGGLSPNLSGKQNALFLQRIYGETGQESRDLEFIRCLADINEELFRKPIKNYSRVVKERFFIAAGLAFDFDAYVLTRSHLWKSGELNARQKDFHDTLRDRTSDKPLLITGNDYGFLQEFCSEGLILEEGKIVFAGSFEDCRQRIDEEALSTSSQDDLLDELDEDRTKSGREEDDEESSLDGEIW